MTEPAKIMNNNIDFMTALKTAIIESLSDKRLIAATEKAVFKQENLSQN